MPKSMEVVRGRRALAQAAADGQSVRPVGTVVDTGDGYSGTYRNRWVRVRLASGAFVRFGASTSGALGFLPDGPVVDVVVRLTGILDLTDTTYLAERARLLGSR